MTRNTNPRAVSVSEIAEGMDDPPPEWKIRRIVIMMAHRSEVSAGPAYGGTGVWRAGKPLAD